MPVFSISVEKGDDANIAIVQLLMHAALAAAAEAGLSPVVLDHLLDALRAMEEVGLDANG